MAKIVLYTAAGESIENEKLSPQFLVEGFARALRDVFQNNLLVNVKFFDTPEEEISMRIEDMEEELHWSQIKLTIEIEEPEKKEPIR